MFPVPALSSASPLSRRLIEHKLRCPSLIYCNDFPKYSQIFYKIHFPILTYTLGYIEKTPAGYPPTSVLATMYINFFHIGSLIPLTGITDSLLSSPQTCHTSLPRASLSNVPKSFHVFRWQIPAYNLSCIPAVCH